MENNLSRNNNFNLLRFVFAFTVLLVHSYDLTLNDSLKPIRSVFNSGVAVEGFFVISGFLIFMSYERSKSLKDYYIKRIKRIYPAYVFVIMMCVLVGAFFTSLSLNEYVSKDLFAYIVANLTFMNFVQPALPGIFSDNPVTSAVNGALWTIKVEVMFYIFVPFLFFFLRKFIKFRFGFLLFIYIASFAYSKVLLYLGGAMEQPLFIELARQLPGQLMFFISGAVLYFYFDWFKSKRHILVIASLLLYFVGSTITFDFFEAISLAVIVSYAAYFIPNIQKHGSLGDFSYGIYIFHFPILQTMISLGLFTQSPVSSLVIAAFCTIFIAVLSWYFIEKPFLKHRKNAKRKPAYDSSTKVTIR